MLAVYRRAHHWAARTRLRTPLVWYHHLGLHTQDVFVASYPRSGSTWLRFLLLESIGKGQARFENVNDVIPELHRHRNVVPVLPGGGRLIKTHERYRRNYQRAICLVRDVRDVVLSTYARDVEMDFTRYFTALNGFDGYVLSHMRGRVIRFGSWHHHVESWLDSPLAKNGNLLLIKYEDLRNNTQCLLAQILDFLGVPWEGEMLMKAIENNSLARMRAKEDEARRTGEVALLKFHRSPREDGRFVRKGYVEGWRGKMTEEQLRIVDQYAGHVLQRLGYAKGSSVTAAPVRV